MPCKGPFSAIVFLHGGLDQLPEKALRERIATRSDALQIPRGGLRSSRGRIRHAHARSPESTDAAGLCRRGELGQANARVDPASVVVYGVSGGGSLALEVAGETRIAALIADEPAVSCSRAC